MKRQKLSMRMGLIVAIVACWLVPIVIILALSGIMLGSSYQQSVQQELDVSAINALHLVEMQMEEAIRDSKAVSYDGAVRDAYRGYLQNGDATALYSAVNDYLTGNFTSSVLYKAVYIQFHEADVSAYVFGQGSASMELLRRCRASAPELRRRMADADTDIRIFLLDGNLYMARNVLGSTFTPYACVVMMLDPAALLRPLGAVSRVSGIEYSIDGQPFALTKDGDILPSESGEEAEHTVTYCVEVEEHSISFSGHFGGYDVWDENPWLRWAVAGVAMMVLPLLALTVWLFYRHVTYPMETLAAANLLVQSGERGYEIAETAPNAEFGKLYDHFNAMSTELKLQFERSYLEQQASQKAQIKALQSQINPHFLNNTLEIINWEARLAENDRVSAMIEALSTMLDAALARDGRAQIPLSEELGYVDAYLYIIRERLGSGFSVTKEIDPDALEQTVPRLILQPIVENAVEHDITARGGGSLCLRAVKEEGQLVLEVEHDGVMTDEDRARIRTILDPDGTEIIRGGQVGLRNVNQRIRLIYGESGVLTIGESAPGKIMVRLTLPHLRRIDK